MLLWRARIRPQLREGRTVLVVAHRNSIRSLAQLVDGLDDAELHEVEVPNATPLVYRFDDSRQMRPKRGSWS